MEQVIMIHKLSSDSMKFISVKKLDYVLNNSRLLSKAQILDVVADLRDEIDRFC